jgi:hypothetical protein
MTVASPTDTTFSVFRSTDDFFWWLPVNDTVAYVALAIGAMIMFIAYFAGGKENMPRIIFSIFVSVIVGGLVMPLLVRGASWLGILSYDWGKMAVIVADLLVVATVATNTYELITVTAKEARPPK